MEKSKFDNENTVSEISRSVELSAKLPEIDDVRNEVQVNLNDYSCEVPRSGDFSGPSDIFREESLSDDPPVIPASVDRVGVPTISLVNTDVHDSTGALTGASAIVAPVINTTLSSENLGGLESFPPEGYGPVVILSSNSPFIDRVEGPNQVPAHTSPSDGYVVESPGLYENVSRPYS